MIRARRTGPALDQIVSPFETGRTTERHPLRGGDGLRAACAPIVLWALFTLARASAGGGAAAPVAFPDGVACGDVSTDRAILWTRTDRAARVNVEVSRDPEFRLGRLRKSTSASAARDFTVKVEVGGLYPATTYYYRFSVGDGASETGVFRTPPRAAARTSVRFAWSSDIDGARPAPINQFEVLERAREDGIDFFVYNGDNVYADNPPPCGGDLDCIRARYRRNRGFRALRDLMSSTAALVLWDDHEVVDDFVPSAVDPASLAAGRRAFLEYMPVPRASPGLGFYRSVRWGKNVELFLLDERSFRTAGAAAACKHDLLPALPADARRRAGLVADPPAGCVEAIGDPRRTMLGPNQKRAFKRALSRSDATWKIVLNQVPIAELFALPYDRWEGYAAERREILRFIRDAKVENVVFLSGDLHAGVIVDVVENRSTAHLPIAREFVAGPVSERTLREEFTDLIGSPDGADSVLSLVSSLAGTVCFSPGAFSYGLVDVEASGRQMTVTIKDARGSPLCSSTLGARDGAERR